MGIVDYFIFGTLSLFLFHSVFKIRNIKVNLVQIIEYFLGGELKNINVY
jgi:hypothetical protein